MVDARRRVVVERRWGVAAQRRDDAREEHRQPVAARVDHAVLAQRGEQLGAALDRLLRRRAPPAPASRRSRRSCSLRLGVRRSRRAPSGSRSSVGGDPLRHLPRDRQDRALRWAAHRRVRARRRRSRAPRRSASRRSARRGARRAPRRRRGSAARGSRRSCRARRAARRARPTARSPRGRSRRSCARSSAPCRRSSSASTARSVSAMLSPVSPSATGNTLRSLTSWRRDSRCASAPATAARKRTRLVSVTAICVILSAWGSRAEPEELRAAPAKVTPRSPGTPCKTISASRRVAGQARQGRRERSVLSTRATEDAAWRRQTPTGPWRPCRPSNSACTRTRAGAPCPRDPHLLEVRLEAALGRDHRVAAAVAERGALAAAVTYLGHRAASLDGLTGTRRAERRGRRSAAARRPSSSRRSRLAGASGVDAAPRAARPSAARPRRRGGPGRACRRRRARAPAPSSRRSARRRRTERRCPAARA